ncbi:BRO family protein [Citrobacter sp. Cpo073]|uniref:BRO-N domain-containing protein n=1 Tax=Citrobacter sp. Cpo073 TaxID=2985134 RepID=UPI002574EC16|nr:BRO family protein [Citrobacter sp. Cpo073]MDM2861401.1 BRO family protein [Citrobacter sp. Cpo073]
MNTTIKTYDFKSDAGELLASVRTLLINNVPWFVAADVALALGYSQTQAMTKLIDDEDKDNQTILIGCNYTNQSVINESGLYAAIMGSRKKQAKRFKRWVTADVLPSIRATGSYSLTPSNDLPDFSDEVAAARAWADEREAARRALGYVERQAKYIEHLENLFSPGMTPTQFCKRLNGVNVQQVTAFLEEHNWLYDDRPESRRPAWRVKAYARDLYLTERRHLVEHDDINSFDAYTPVLLRKGAVWIYRQYLKGVLPMKKSWNGEFTHDKELAGAA